MVYLGYHGYRLQLLKAHRLPLAEVITINFLIGAVDEAAPLGFIALTLNKILEPHGRLSVMENTWSLVCLAGNPVAKT